MAKKTPEESENLFKKCFDAVKGTRKSGWYAEDSERTVLSLIPLAFTDKDGKEFKPSKELTSRITAALQITPQRIVKFITSELESAGAVVDGTTEEQILWLVDLTKVRGDLTSDGILEKTGKGKKAKKKITDLLK